MRILRLFIRPTQADKAFFDFELLRLRKREPGFFRKILGNGIGADVDAPRINAALFKEQQVAGLGPDIQQHGAAFQITIVIAKRIAERCRGNIHQLQAQPSRFGDSEKPLHDVGFDGDEQDL